MREALNEFLGDNVKVNIIDENTKEVCDLDTGKCKIISVKDGLIERHDLVDNKFKVKTNDGKIKNLIKG